MARRGEFCRSASMALVLCVLVSISTREVGACTPYPCYGGYYLPGTGEVPSSIEAILWMPRNENFVHNPADPSNVGIFQLSGTEEIPVGFSLETVHVGTLYVLRLESGLEAGSRYLLRSDDLCLDGTIEAEILTADPSPAPASLGVLVAGDPHMATITVATWSGSCDTEISAAIVDVELELSEDASPWATSLDYATIVDGEPWTPSSSLAGMASPDPYDYVGGSWVGRARDRIFVLCDSPDPSALRGVEEGAHTVEMRASLPGSTVEVVSSPVIVDLRCEAASEPDDASSDTVDDAQPYMPVKSESGCGCVMVL